jgi:hypothetical protein
VNVFLAVAHTAGLLAMAGKHSLRDCLGNNPEMRYCSGILTMGFIGGDRP